MRKIEFSPPDITDGDIVAVDEALHSGWITTGPKAAEFEEELTRWCGAAGAVCLNSATAALELTLFLLGVGPGDEVILPAYTYTATAAAVWHTGARPVMVDVHPGSYHIDPALVAAAVTPATKAVIPVDVGGVLCDYPALRKVLEEAASRFLPASPLQEALGRPALVADAAHSLGAELWTVPCGRWADFTCFSFHAVKNLTTAEGGAVVWQSIPGTDNRELARRLHLLSLHGQTKDALSKSRAGGWEYDILFPGHKCNMTDLCAALGLAQLARYPRMLARRQELIARYNRELAPLTVTPMAHRGESFRSSGHLYMVEIEGCELRRRDEIIHRLAQKGVAANVHYKPLPLLTAWKRLGYRPGDYPVSMERYERELTLPLHTRLTDEDVEYVCRAMADALTESR